MQNICLFVTICLLAFSNCKKNQIPISEPEDPIDTTSTPVDTPPDSNHIIELGKGFALNNGAAWSPPFMAAYHYKTTARFTFGAKIIHDYLSNESFGIRDIPCAIGKYPIEDPKGFDDLHNLIPEAYFVYIRDYDTPVGDFLADTTRNDHFIEIIRYDSVEQTIEGRFQVFLKKLPTNTWWPNIPDSISLTEGRFHLKIKTP
ncbi:MAG: hypothetical protein L6Q97_20365 [Thermoanaerobaculia bacterium]|nr:hypothetical protein [Thermoanaerobaculia bacterium]